MFLARHQQVALEACRRFIDTSQSGEVCYHWLPQGVKDLGVTQHHLKQLADLGYLTKVDTVRGGGRVYYKLGWKSGTAASPFASAGKAQPTAP